MNTQTMLVIGALVILGSITLMVNRTLQDTSRHVTESTRIMTALSIGEAMINEIKNRRFDNNPNADTVAGGSNVFASANSLGPQSGETYPNFNDINDYNGLNITKSVNFGNGATESYQVQVQLYYVSNDDFTTVRSSPTYNKHVTVKVKSPFLYKLNADSSVTLDYIVSYQNMHGQRPVN